MPECVSLVKKQLSRSRLKVLASLDSQVKALFEKRTLESVRSLDFVKDPQE